MLMYMYQSSVFVACDDFLSDDDCLLLEVLLCCLLVSKPVLYFLNFTYRILSEMLRGPDLIKVFLTAFAFL